MWTAYFSCSACSRLFVPSSIVDSLFLRHTINDKALNHRWPENVSKCSSIFLRQSAQSSIARQRVQALQHFPVATLSAAAASSPHRLHLVDFVPRVHCLTRVDRVLRVFRLLTAYCPEKYCRPFVPASVVRVRVRATFNCSDTFCTCSGTSCPACTTCP